VDQIQLALGHISNKKESKGLKKLEFDGKVVKVDTIVDMIPQPVVALHIYKESSCPARKS
jgi:hypothetical protein